MKIVRTKLGAHPECQAEALAEQRKAIVRGNVKSSITLAAEMCLVSLSASGLLPAVVSLVWVVQKPLTQPPPLFTQLFPQIFSDGVLPTR